MTRSQCENVVVAMILVTLLAFLVLSIKATRREIRDDLRRQDIQHLKHALEVYANAYQDVYIAPPEHQARCTRSDEVDSWFFTDSVLLRQGMLDAMPHDRQEGKGRAYSYCATDIRGSQALGYYLQAELEVDQPSTKAFDEDEQSKYFYRVVHQNGGVMYRVCGGTERQCVP